MFLVQSLLNLVDAVLAGTICKDHEGNEHVAVSILCSRPSSRVGGLIAPVCDSEEKQKQTEELARSRDKALGGDGAEKRKVCYLLFLVVLCAGH
jgi:hypothetical protein